MEAALSSQDDQNELPAQARLVMMRTSGIPVTKVDLDPEQMR